MDLAQVEAIVLYSHGENEENRADFRIVTISAGIQCGFLQNIYVGLEFVATTTG
jgi:hypothetical protein